MSKDNENAVPSVDPDTLKSNEVARTILATGVKLDDFRVNYSGGRATLTGSVHSQDDRKRVLDAARTVGGVTVEDSLRLGGSASGGASLGGGRSYTVKSGDTLSGIAKSHYGDASSYNRIFEANRNILSDPDKIQPGQVLNIPE